jgi:NAD(P)H-hydrate epimerase
LKRGGEIVELTRDQVRRVDELAIRELGIPSVVLMENAGRNAAEIVWRRLGPFLHSESGRVVVFAGSGNNGGDGFVVARHLANRGARVDVRFCGDREKLTPDAATNLRILERMRMPIQDVSTPERIVSATGAVRAEDVMIDALLGTGFQGTVREPMAALIAGINFAKRRAIVAIDLPSGLDCDSGQPANATIRATLTITFVARKIGFGAPGASDYTGEVVVADIGAPPSLVDRVRG